MIVERPRRFAATILPMFPNASCFAFPGVSQGEFGTGKDIRVPSPVVANKRLPPSAKMSPDELAIVGSLRGMLTLT